MKKTKPEEDITLLMKVGMLIRQIHLACGGAGLKPDTKSKEPVFARWEDDLVVVEMRLKETPLPPTKG